MFTQARRASAWRLAPAQPGIEQGQGAGRLAAPLSPYRNEHEQARNQAARDFEKPAHWSNDPPPKPGKPEVDKELSPTRYGDWAKDGIAIDF